MNKVNIPPKNTSKNSNSIKNNSAINKYISQLNKKFGDAEAARLGNATLNLPHISTGSNLLDKAIGKGIYKNRIAEIYGLEGSGKTTLCLGIAREAQKDPKNFVVFVDAECALTASLIKMNGVDPERLVVIQPQSGEKVFEAILHWLSFNKEQKDDVHLPLIIVDSVAAIVPTVELNNNMSSQQVGAQARLISKGLRKIIGHLALSDLALVFINQVRSKVGVIYGNPEITAGGHALRFYSSLRLRVKKNKVPANNDGIIHSMDIRITKNKFESIRDPVTLEIIDGIGYDKYNETITMAIESDVLRVRGSWIYKGEEKIAQGKKKAILYYKENPQKYDELKSVIFSNKN